MFTYEFPKENLLLVTDHALALDIVIASLSLVGGVYRVVTEQQFPVEQLDHLGLTEVA